MEGLIWGLLQEPARSPVLLGVVMFHSSLFTRPYGLPRKARHYCTAL